MFNSTNLFHTEESAYLGRVFSDLEQTLMIVGSSRSTESLSILFKQSFNVISVKNDEGSIKDIGDQEIDLILVDTDGDTVLWVEFLRQIQADPLLNFTPVIVLSETDAVNEQLTALELGALDVLVKPINPFVLSAKISNHMQLMKSVRELELVSCTDGLTGLANRMQLDTMLLSEWHRMRRSKRPLSTLMIDVDHFKLFNDKYGHLQGDECLKKIANVIKVVTGRDTDFAARFGGEEFVILLPCTDHSGAEIVAESLLDEILSLQYSSAHSNHEFLSVSIGIACCLPHVIGDDVEPNWLLEEADKNLYKAKLNGRNQFCG